MLGEFALDLLCSGEVVIFKIKAWAYRLGYQNVVAIA